MATRIVALGASAGGLKPLEQFLAHVPVPSGLAYIVVQHLDPTHKAILIEILRRTTAMLIREAVTSMRVEPNTVYVIPPNTELTVKRGLLHLAVPRLPRGIRLPIDVLFCSLARDQGAQAVGVVLSGMGADGTIGLQAIKTQGGLTFAQEPSSAEFDSMPKSAIASGAVDVIAEAADLPARVLRLTEEPHGVRDPGEVDESIAEPAFDTILTLLRERSKRELTLYKPSTLRRRIERRMIIHGAKAMTEYEAFLRENPLEQDLLLKEMLIGVTSFFRDPVVWEEFKSGALRDLFAQAEHDRRFRAWVVGCSTGEEAYTLAMVFVEVRVQFPDLAACSLQIFASDLSADAIAFARRGRYPASIAKDVSAPRLARFFRPHADGYVIDPDIRDMVLFAQHDVIMDPPFTRLDLLTCRNLLIYLNASLQRRLIPLFHYSLRPGGALMLGASETVGPMRHQFLALSSKSRLYRRAPGETPFGVIDFSCYSGIAARTSEQVFNMTKQTRPEETIQALTEQFLLKKYTPPSVLVNAHGDVLYISGHTGNYLEPAAGKANWNIHVMARAPIRTQLTVAVHRAIRERTCVKLTGLRAGGDEAPEVDITVESVTEPKGIDGLVLIVFHERCGVLPVSAVRSEAGDASGASAELLRTQDELKMLREAMRASEEERQAAIEELQSMNEELQSANEELTTSKEEAQSMNEELETVNVELQSKLDDLALAQDDMQNLLNSTEIATLFLDNDMNVRRFTDQIKHLINLRTADVGRPLSDLTSTLNYPQIHADAKETLRSQSPREKEISTSDGHWFKVRIMPYRTVANVIHGAVITFVDITAAKQLEQKLREH
ncbi:MAG: chemotaxis protein CheB [Steroidobacteraceae bacterium]